MNVSIVIPNYNGKHLLEKNFSYVLKALKNLNNNIIEIIIVDDGSTDDSVSFLNSQFKNEIKLIKHTKNRGFSSAVNIGVRATSGDIILLLNSDVTPTHSFLENLDKYFSDSKVFAVSLHEKGYGAAKGSFKNGFIEIGSKKESKKQEYSFYVSGGSGLFRKSIWQELGGMDEKLLSPFYWEDIDLCFRAAKRGYINLWDPESEVVHIHESTISTLPQKYANRIRERNQLLMLWKNIHSKSLITKHINGLLRRVIKSPGYLLIVLMALSKIGLVLKARQKEIKECVVSDEAVFQKYA